MFARECYKVLYVCIGAIPDEGEVELKLGPPSSTGFDVEQGIIRVQPESGVNRCVCVWWRGGGGRRAYFF